MGTKLLKCKEVEKTWMKKETGRKYTEIKEGFEKDRLMSQGRAGNVQAS